MKKIYSLFLLAFLLNVSVFAQTDSLRVQPDDEVDMQVEDIMTNTETESSVDYTIITDFLTDLRRNPLNLNLATREELLQLPGLNDILINNLFKHIAEFGELTSVFELQAIEGFTEKVVAAIQPYVSTDARPKDIDPNRMHPAGPSFREIREGMKYDFIQRTVTVLEPQLGYTDNKYAGSKTRSYSRFRGKMGQNVSFGIVGEKDAGEKFGFNPQIPFVNSKTGQIDTVKTKNYYGTDFLAGHIAISNFGNLKNLVIGDFNLQAGQGLVFSSGLGFGKSGEVILPIKMPSKGVTPYASVNENAYKRGIIASYAVKRLYFTAFVSRLRIDGGTITNDSIENDINGVISSGESTSSFQLGGYHRTYSELKNRKNVSETSYGGRIEYKGKSFRIGTSHSFQQYSVPIQPSPNYYNSYYFSGDKNMLNGVDFDWVYQNFNLFGEIARSKSGGLGMVYGLMAALSSKVDLALHYRNYAPNFQTQHSFAFGESPRTPRNERGFYTGLRIKPTSKWMISTYFDRFSFPQNRFGTAYYSGGYEYLAQIDYVIRKGTQIYVRFKSEHKEKNATSDFYNAAQPLYYLVPIQNTHLRVHFQTQVSKEIMLRSRAEASWYKGTDQQLVRGFMVYQDFFWHLTQKMKVSGRYAIFDVQDYNARIYAFETTMPGDFQIPSYGGSIDTDKDNGKGTRYYLMLQYQPLRFLTFWVRLSQTRYFSNNFSGNGQNNAYYPTNTIGSGSDMIIGNTKSELRLQMRLTF